MAVEQEQRGPTSEYLYRDTKKISKMLELIQIGFSLENRMKVVLVGGFDG